MYRSAVTDPEDHDTDNFAYLAHGTNPGRESVEYSVDRLLGESDGQQYLCASLLFNYKDGLAGETAHLGHTITCRHQQGLIIRPTEGQVEIAYPMDVRSPIKNDNQQFFMERYGGKILESPETLLKDTPDGMNNEIILRGDPDAEIDGVFYKEGMEHSDQYKENALDIADYVEERFGHDVPVVPIPDVVDDRDRPEGGEPEDLWKELCDQKDTIMRNWNPNQ